MTLIYNKIIMDVKNEQTIKSNGQNHSVIEFMTLLFLLISINSQMNKVLFNSSYYLVNIY